MQPLSAPIPEDLPTGGSTSPPPRPSESNVPAGVETAVESRFVDYTLATPWEHLVADIEKTIKLWTATSQEGQCPGIVYYFNKYVIYP